MTEGGVALHNYQLSPILHGRRRWNGQNPIRGRKGRVVLVFSLYPAVAGLLSPAIVSAVNEEGKAGAGC